MGGVQAACSGKHRMLYMQCAQETLGMCHVHSLHRGAFCFIVSLDHAWSVPSKVLSILPDSTKVWLSVPPYWKSISHKMMCYNFTPLLNKLFRICGKLFTQEGHKVSLPDSPAGPHGPRSLLLFHKNSERDDNSKRTNYLHYRKR